MLSVLLITTVTAAGSVTRVEWETDRILQVDQPPLDTAVTPDGKHLFVLTRDGIFVYSEEGKIEDRIQVGFPVDRISIGPQGKRLFITSTTEKTVQVLDIAFIYKIHLSDSPFKGPRDAPVVIAVFSDFQ